MSFTLRVDFTGLLSYVPKRSSPDDSFSEVLILLPTVGPGKLIHVGRVANPAETMPIPTHIACLIVEERHIDPTSEREPALVYKRQGKTLCLFEFLEENLRLQQDVDPGGVQPVLEGPRHSLSLVPPLPAPGIADADVFDAARLLRPQDVPRPDLAGTVTLDDGTFRAAGPRTDADGKPVTFDFMPVDATEPVFSQPVAIGIESIINIEGEAVTLAFCDKKGDRPGLVLRPCDPGNFVEVWVTNRELEEILELGSGQAPRVNWDTDPAIFYTFSKAEGDLANQALPVAKMKKVGRGNAGCDPRRFSSSE